MREKNSAGESRCRQQKGLALHKREWVKAALSLRALDDSFAAGTNGVKSAISHYPLDPMAKELAEKPQHIY
jgi:hypothetical protein